MNPSLLKKSLAVVLLPTLVALAGCEGGGIPDPAPGGGGGGGPTEQIEPPEELPKPSDPVKSLWPLTTGSSWTYRIDDPLRGTFEKTVTVLGPQKVPERDVEAIAVQSVQPHLEELSWQIDQDGLVSRLREEDSKDGMLVRVMSWTPSTLKSLSAEQPVGWQKSISAHEVEQLPDGTLKTEKDKVFLWAVVAVEETVTTPAGTFKALKVTRERPDKTDWTRTYWLVPGVGKVREEGERTEVLLRYDIKPE